MNHECPCCGRPRSSLPVDVLDLLDGICKPRKEQLALDVLIWKYPKIVSRSLMEKSLYDDVGEAAPTCVNTIPAHICHLKAKLRTVGWTVRALRHQGYRLEPAATADE